MDQMRGYGVMGMEMEASAILTVCHRYGARGCAICACGANSDSKEAAALKKEITQKQILITLDAIFDFHQAKESQQVYLEK